MYPLLLALSFVLHLFAFFLIILLSMRLKRANEIEKRQMEIQKEIEDVFQSYMLEMKEENEKLLKMIEKAANSHESKIPTGKKTVITNNKSNQIESVETYKPPVKLQGKLTQQIYKNQKPLKPNTSLVQDKAHEYKPPVPVGEDQYEQSLTSQVVLLHEKGFKPDEIAQKLNKGKTEIELLLKFRGQNHN